jgi:hypothetical protein
MTGVDYSHTSYVQHLERLLDEHKDQRKQLQEIEKFLDEYEIQHSYTLVNMTLLERIHFALSNA